MSSSKRGKSTGNSAIPAGVFISFSDVADSTAAYASQHSPLSPGGPSPAESVVASESAVGSSSINYAPETAICYTGPYPQIALLCRRIMKKDGVTKLKAIKELRGVLKVYFNFKKL